MDTKSTETAMDLPKWAQLDTIYTTPGARLRAERERLGLSQDEFAERCGVHRRTQGNYELDKRIPGADYWREASKCGVDVNYVQSGIVVSVDLTLSQATTILLNRILETLGYTDADISKYCEGAFELEKKRAAANDRPAQSEFDQEARRYALDFILSGPAMKLDSALLGQVITAIEAEIVRAGTKVPPEKLGQLVLAGYRGAKALGRLDRLMIADAVTLAA